METLTLLNRLIGIIFLLCYSYQFCYIPLVWRRRRRALPPAAPLPHRFAVLICARNEESVIGDLLESLRHQTYHRGEVTVFVMADNCTDRTAAVAREAGAAVYQRRSADCVGKGYALNALMRHIAEDYSEGFDGYFVFDADNILAPDYIERMNDTFSRGYPIVTGYRNSKNYGDNWISAGSALCFLRESRYLNHARMLLGTSCSVNGTGFLFSRAVAEEMGPWPFHTLTEDTEFSVWQILRGSTIGFCPEAVLYDEQPVSFRQSWRQRSRWSKGYCQVFARYGGALVQGAFRGRFACYDMMMAIMPAFVLSIVSSLCTLALAIYSAATGGSLWAAAQSLGESALGMYATLFAIGAITTASEWRAIRTAAWKKVAYAFTFPLFMVTYLPIAVCALFSAGEWKPIAHRVSAASLRQRKEQDLLPF